MALRPTAGYLASHATELSINAFGSHRRHEQSDGRCGRGRTASLAVRQHCRRQRFDRHLLYKDFYMRFLKAADDESRALSFVRVTMVIVGWWRACGLARHCLRSPGQDCDSWFPPAKARSSPTGNKVPQRLSGAAQAGKQALRSSRALSLSGVGEKRAAPGYSAARRCGLFITSSTT